MFDLQHRNQCIIITGGQVQAGRRSSERVWNAKALCPLILFRLWSLLSLGLPGCMPYAGVQNRTRLLSLVSFFPCILSCSTLGSESHEPPFSNYLCPCILSGSKSYETPCSDLPFHSFSAWHNRTGWLSIKYIFSLLCLGLYAAVAESHDSPFSDQFCPCILLGCALWSKVAWGSHHWSFLTVHSFGGTLWFSCLVGVVLVFILLVHCGSKSLEAPFSGRFCPCIRLGLHALSQSRPRLPSLVCFVLAFYLMVHTVAQSRTRRV